RQRPRALGLGPDAAHDLHGIGGAQIGGDQQLFQLLEHGLVDGPSEREEPVEPLADGLPGALEALLETIRPPAEEAHHDPDPAGSWGRTSFWITAPLAPSEGRRLPSRSISTPPALPTVSVKRFVALHSLTAPVCRSSSATWPSSTCTRSHVGSTARTI